MAEDSQNPEQNSQLAEWMRKINPVVPKHWLLLIAGLMWSGVGILLSCFAITWLAKALSMASILLGLFGVGISIFANRYQFSKLARKNIRRILGLNPKACVFAFQAWSGYLIIAVMMTGGMYLRSTAIPKPYLAVIYAAIGGSLLQASLHYYTHFARARNDIEELA